MITGPIPIPCYNKHPPREVDEGSLETLKLLCPLLFEPGHNSTGFCCNPEQIHAMKASLDQAKPFIGKCPSCYYNWKNIFCQLSCSPHQSDFVEITQTKPFVEKNITKQQVYSANYHISHTFAQGTFESCEGIAGPTGKAIHLMCGTSDCKRDDWYNFMGKASYSGGYSPFQINFAFTNETSINGTYYPMNVPTVPCNMKINDQAQVCSCTDCEATCKTDRLPKWAKRLSSPPQNFKILGRPGGLVIAWILFLSSVVLIIGYHISVILKRSRSFSRKFVNRFTPILTPTYY